MLPAFLPLAVACAPVAFDVQTTLSPAVPTVVTVEWQTEAEGTGVVTYGEGDTVLGQASAQQADDGTWRSVVVGLPEGTTGWVQVEHPDAASDPVVVTTEPRPGWVPSDPEVTGACAEGFYVTGLRTSDARAGLVVDRWGRAVWWLDVTTWGSLAYISRMRLDPAGDALWLSIIKLNSDPDDADVDQGVVRASLDGTEIEHIELPRHHHDLVVHADGTITYIAKSTRTVDDREVDTDVLMVRDPDGTHRQLWTPEPLLEGDKLPALNGLEYVEDTDSYYVSAKGLNLLVQVDATTGEQVEVIGATNQATLVLDVPFTGQHGFEVQGDTLTVFDNGPLSLGDSRARRYALDRSAGTGTQVFEHGAEPELYSSFLGEAWPLEGGGTLVNWTTHGHVEQVDADGAVDCTWQYGSGDMLTYGMVVPQVGP